jgi:hypothetical protein
VTKRRLDRESRRDIDDRLFSRSLDSKTCLGLQECINHTLLLGYPVMAEERGRLVAQFKMTVLVLQSGAVRVTASNFPLPYVHSELSLTPELEALVATKVHPKSAKLHAAGKGVEDEMDLS